MSFPISSAGVVYLYLNGYEIDGYFNIQTINSYNHIGINFYKMALEVATISEQDDRIVHIFAVIGTKEKAKDINQIIEDILKNNYQCILNGESIQKVSSYLDDVGNIFNQLVQEFFCEQLGHYPKRLFIDYKDFVFAGICCNHESNVDGDVVIDHIISLWIDYEQPKLCGKQLMIKSFFMQDFIGRKVVASIPQKYSGNWRLIFEGGHQFLLEKNFSYFKETLSPNDLDGFCVSNIQTILLNPIYAYGIWLKPNDLSEEWHKVFIYLCAASDCKWNKRNFQTTYNFFLEFLIENICNFEKTTPIIKKETHYLVLLKYIEQFRNFLKGLDEPVISKDLHQTLNSRYVYLPYIWSLVSHKNNRKTFSVVVLRHMINKAVKAKSSYERGILWEDAVSYMIQGISEWKITGRRIRAGSQEIDISIINISLDDMLWKLGAYILIECKNWHTRVNLPQIRNIAHISNMKGNKTVLLFAINGVTKNAMDEIKRLAVENLSILCITLEDLIGINDLFGCKELILQKWTELQEAIEDNNII